MSNYQRQEYMLRPQMKVIIHLPADLSHKEANRVKKYINLGVSSKPAEQTKRDE